MTASSTKTNSHGFAETVMPLPEPYTMCRKDECQERQSQMQVSEFEATLETQHEKSPKYRVLDPRLAIAKYRRSAAGEDFRKRPPRSLEAIRITIHHLLSLLEHQAVFCATIKCNNNNNNNNQNSTVEKEKGRPVKLSSLSKAAAQSNFQVKPSSLSKAIVQPSVRKKSLATTVAFVDDRIRACQVDIVVGQYTTCGTIQSQLVRYHILMLYLMSDLPRKTYEPQFAIKALWTSFGAYWNRNDGDKSKDGGNHNDADDDDEIMCLSFLCQIASCLLRDEAALSNSNKTAKGWNDSLPAGYSALLQDYSCKIKKKTTRHQQKQNVSKWTQFALDIASASQSGFFHTILSLLSNVEEEETTNTTVESLSYFLILCRCCMAPALNVIRLGALRQYNKSLGGKQEKISAEEMARLLYLPDADEAVLFCKSVGLPIVQNGDDWDSPSFIVTKTAPISIADTFQESMQNTSRKEDPFVFGTTIYQQMKMTSLQNRSNMKDDNANNYNNEHSNTAYDDNTDKHLVARIDEDGILIPSPQTISNLIRPKPS